MTDVLTYSPRKEKQKKNMFLKDYHDGINLANSGRLLSYLLFFFISFPSSFSFSCLHFFTYFSFLPSSSPFFFSSLPSYVTSTSVLSLAYVRLRRISTLLSLPLLINFCISFWFFCFCNLFLFLICLLFLVPCFFAPVCPSFSSSFQSSVPSLLSFS